MNLTKENAVEKIAGYLSIVGLLGLLGNLIGWWRDWFWIFLGSFILSFIMFVVLQKQGKIKQ